MASRYSFADAERCVYSRLKLGLRVHYGILDLGHEGNDIFRQKPSGRNEQGNFAVRTREDNGSTTPD